MSVSEEKKSCRARARSALEAMTPAAVAGASEAIQASVLGLREFSACEQVFCYLSFGKEVVTDLIVEAAWKSGKSVVVPVFHGGVYDLVEYRSGDSLVTGHYGIREPKQHNTALIRSSVLAVVPGLAFDRCCRRLGRGAGYYDRMLSRLASEASKLFCAGLTYQCTLFAWLPTEPHDFNVDAVLTEKESVRRPDTTAGRPELLGGKV
jgi:5-formyltetrahydrofolate cyclo-ligase